MLAGLWSSKQSVQFSHAKLVGYSEAAAAARWNKAQNGINIAIIDSGSTHATNKYHKICGSRETQNGRPCMGILIVQSFKVNDKGVFSLLELKFRNEMWPRIMTNPTMSMLPPLDILLAKSRAV